MSSEVLLGVGVVVDNSFVSNGCEEDGIERGFHHVHVREIDVADSFGRAQVDVEALLVEEVIAIGRSEEVEILPRDFQEENVVVLAREILEFILFRCALAQLFQHANDRA